MNEQARIKLDKVQVKRDEIVVELETDKVSLEVAAPHDGVLSEIDAEEGATVAPGQKLARLDQAGAPAAATSCRSGFPA